MTDTADLLAAGSLILTVLAVLYSIWYPEVQSTLAIALPVNYDDAVPLLTQIRKVRNQQTTPLFIASLATTLIFLPKAIGVLTGAIDDLADRGLKAISDYDPIQTTFVLVVIFTGFLAWQTLQLSRSLKTKYNSRKPA